MHGDEPPGTRALEKLAGALTTGRLRLLRGSVTLAARVNAGAAKRGLHFLDENLNRVVRLHAAPATHEQRLANELVPLLDAADTVLDLHGTQAPSPPFAFLDDESVENRAWADSLGLPFLLAGWPALYAGGSGATTTEYAQQRGKRALTVEAGCNDDPAAGERGFTVAVRALAHLGLTAPWAAAPRPRLLRFSRIVRREREGVFTRPWTSFDAVKQGDVIARYADGETVAAPEDGLVIMPFAGAALGEEWFYLAK